MPHRPPPRAPGTVRGVVRPETAREVRRHLGGLQGPRPPSLHHRGRRGGPYPAGSRHRLIVELAAMFDIGIPPPHWFDASDELVETVYQVALDYAEARRAAGEA